MKAQIRLGRIFGIELGLHYSWFIIALLITMSLVGEFQALNPRWGTGVIWATAIATGLFFFVSIILHEFSHAAVARSRHLPVRAITLFALGGISQIERESDDPGTEFLIGIAGPITSMLIGVLCLMLAWTLGWSPAITPRTPALAMLMWLGYINVSLAIFNLVPGFPLDGGRVLRGIIWWLTGDGLRATRLAARTGQIIAFAFIIFGIVRFFNGAGIGGLWIAFIGWFLLEAAGSSRAQVEISQRLKDVRVADIIERDCPVIAGDETLQSFVDQHLLRSGRSCFLVQQGDEVTGIITPHEVKGVDRTRWATTRVDQAMRPLRELSAVTPDTAVTAAIEIMNNKDVNQLPVVRNGHIEGLVTRGGLLRLLQTRAELEM